MTELTDEAVKALLDGATPGPWVMETVRTSCGTCHRIGPFPRPAYASKSEGWACVYDDYPPGVGSPDLLANSRLIAAAPDLARALLASEAARKLAEERLAKALVAREKIKAAYEELLATVHGECPSLINEDSGGSQVLLDLILAADEAITTIKELNE